MEASVIDYMWMSLFIACAIAGAVVVANFPYGGDE